MQRDMDLVREILLRLEMQKEPHSRMNLEIEGFTEEEVAYHAQIMEEAGLIETMQGHTVGFFRVYPTRLTWAGHDFLDAARDDTHWNRAKERAAEVGGTLTLETWKDLLTQMVREQLGLG